VDLYGGCSEVYFGDEISGVCQALLLRVVPARLNATVLD
jgi:hypothetical protein